MIAYDVVFLGGIHAVGKSTFCEYLLEYFDIEHIGASTLIKHPPQSFRYIN